MGLDGLHPDFIQLFHEQFPVLSVHDGLHGSPKHLHSVLFQNAFLKDFHSAVKRSLAPERKQNPLRPFFLDDFLHKERSDRKEINLIGYTLRCLDGRDVRID